MFTGLAYQAFNKLSTGLEFSKSYITPYLESALGRRPRFPNNVMITRLPEWAKFNGLDPCCRSVTVSKMLAGIIDDTLIGDLSLAVAPQDLLDYWLIPHELLHTLGLEEEVIDRILIIMNRRLGMNHVASYIASYSEYIRGEDGHGHNHGI